MNAQKLTERNRLNYSGIIDIVVKSGLYEGSPAALWAGFYTYLISTLLYASLTVYVTDSITTSWKRGAGLKEWQL
jgi:hypothetical protein